MAMDADIKRDWITALHSEDYQQGKHHLNAKDADGVDRLCCLGVLCELAAQAGVVTKSVKPATQYVNGVRVEREVTFYHSPGDTVGDDALPPEAVKEWAKLEQRNPVLLNRIDAASDLNDVYSMTFEQIAVIIEDKL